MTAQPDPSREPFEKFLVWLSSDRDLALEKHDEIMRRMRKYFVRKGCPDSEELAGETRDRVIRIVDNGSTNPNADALFFSVAANVWREYLRKPKPEPLPAPDLLPALTQDTQHKESLVLCLEKCLARLPVPDRNFIQCYYETRGGDSGERKQLLMAEHGEESTLRVRAFRIRGKLRTCIKGCMAELEQ